MSFDGVDIKASMVCVEVVEQAGPLPVGAVPLLQPTMPVNTAAAKKIDRIPCSSLVMNTSGDVALDHRQHIRGQIGAMRG